MAPSRKPNWSKWRHMLDVKVWQAVALSLDIDPDKLQRNPHAWMSGAPGFLEGREFADRLDVVCANIGSGRALTPVAYPSEHKASWPVQMREFVAWCMSIDWPIPDELRALVGAPTPVDASSESTVTVASEYFRQQNAQLAAQVAKFANEAGYAQLVSTVDAKDLPLNFPPDWPHWANMAYVTLGDAACLSLGISPEARFPQIDLSAVRERALAANADLTRVQLGVAALERAQRMIQQRVEQAMSAIEAGRLPSGPQSIPQILRLAPTPLVVSLPRYRRWAESLPEPYVFPEGFPPAEPRAEPIVYSSVQPETLATGDEKPLREPERGNLLAIIHALAVMASVPDRGGAPSVERQLQLLKYDRPKERTIRAVLNEARKIKD